MAFAPIAIIGRACLLPGAHAPSELLELARDGRDALCTAPPGRWRLPEAHVTDSEEDAGTWRAGYVSGFTFDPSGYLIDADELEPLDPLVHWVLDTARRALRDAGTLGSNASRTGAVLGNLSLPSTDASRFAEQVWLGSLADRLGLAPVDVRNRFNSGLPAHLLARAVGLGLGAFALDAACASSLYAIELACRDLQQGRADRMLAGAVNRADDLFLHVGFRALGAMSPTGQSRPFHEEADGLVHAEGCGFVVLERLEDAVRAGRTIHGVIRGVGLANDGRGNSLLAPSARGQARSMRLALQQAELTADDISYIECHATGTPVGDATELESMRAVYGERPRTIGSLKANLGHLITAAGIAGLVKVLESIREGVFLPTPHLDAPSAALEASPFETLERPAPWSGPRRAGLSAFGFGGNDAHVVVEAHEPRRVLAQVVSNVASSAVVVVAMGARFGDGQSTADLERRLFRGAGSPRADVVRLPVRSLRFPPTDLEKASAQQTMLLSAALEATESLVLPRDTTGVFVGYQCDPEIARWGARWRVRSWGETLGADDAWIEEAQQRFAPSLESAHVVGTLPNIPANRLSAQFDLCGPSFTTSSEELSGLRALAIAVDALRRGELDAALVGAVDRSVEPVHQTAVGKDETADAAVVLVLRRKEDAVREGLSVLAEVTTEPDTAGAFASGLPSAHAASGLVEVACAVLCAARSRRPDGSAWEEQERRLRVDIEALGDQRSGVTIVGRGEAAAAIPEPVASQPVLELAAHLPRVALAPLRTSAQSMPPAPELPPTSCTAPPAPAMSASALRSAYGPNRGAVAESSPPLGVHAAPTAAGVEDAPPLPKGSWLAAFAEQQMRIAAAHQRFVTQQAELHRQFLQMALRVPWDTSSPGSPIAEAVPAPVADFVTNPPAAPTSLASAGPAVPPVETPQGTLGAPSAIRRTRAHADSSRKAAPESKAGQPPVAFQPRGPSFSREQLLVHACGTISDIFGPLFEQQDHHAVQVRMPAPPLLLADRCTGIDAKPGSMKTGTCWTETDVRADSWYLHDGAMPAGIMVESGQADLFLISYLGADFLNRGERAYRLLGCEIKWTGDLPKIGETLVYEIHIDGHASQGDVRLFFFHYDCHIRGTDGTTRPALEVRRGQAGFFSTRELADSTGILWRPDAEPTPPPARVDPPRVPLARRSFGREDLEAFAAGRPWDCFGERFLRTRTHTRTPRIQDGNMLFLHAIEELDPEGGPWGRGYLRARAAVSSDDWYFAGHFKNDPCMPGTLMFEGCVQAMAFYLTAMGYAIDKDGWRFQPITDETYPLLCRGQVTPTNRELTYEIFVVEIHDGPEPRVYADLLGTVDGLGAFYAKRFGLKLSPEWPLSSRPDLAPTGQVDSRAATASWQGGQPHRFDASSLLACAWGKPSTAFGPMYDRFDGVRRTPRLPGPPYLFITRVTRVDGAMGGLETGTTFEFEYEIPDNAWYFDANGARIMPFAVLLEAALQPCGWIASYAGSTLTTESDLLFRNLDGSGTVRSDVFPDSGTLRSVVSFRSVSASGGMLLVSFGVRCLVGDTEIYELETVFGFFPPSALENQAGLPTTDAQQALHDAAPNVCIAFKTRPERFFSGSLRIAGSMLLMLDRVVHLDLGGGSAGLGALRAEKDVDPGEWFFKAHFYQDPVQPGSLGIEAMLQLLQVFMIEAELGKEFVRPRFEAIATELPHTWKYRGQVLPENKCVTTTLEIVEIGRDDRGAYALADASLWVDDKRIYEAHRLGMRIVEDERGTSDVQPTATRRDAGDKDVASGGALDIAATVDFWRDWFGIGAWPAEDLFYGLVERFAAGFHVEDASALAALRGRGALYLGNHQTAIESLILSIVAPALHGVPMHTLAKVEHQTSWLGRLVEQCFRYPGVQDPGMLTYFDRQDPGSLLGIARELASTTAARSVMVHVEGTRARSARQRIERMSGIFCDLALDAGVPIIPVRFSGGLPVEPAANKLDFPVGMGRQDYWLGTPIAPSELATLSYKQRIDLVVARIVALGPRPADEQPHSPDQELEALVAARAARGVPRALATVVEVLRTRRPVGAETARLLDAIETGDFEPLGNDARGRWARDLARMLR